MYICNAVIRHSVLCDCETLRYNVLTAKRVVKIRSFSVSLVINTPQDYSVLEPSLVPKSEYTGKYFVSVDFFSGVL